LVEQAEAPWRKHAAIAIAVIAVLAGYSAMKGSEYSGKASSELALSEHWLTDYETASSYAALWATRATYYDSLARHYGRLGDEASSAFYQDLYLKTMTQYETESLRAIDNYKTYTETYERSNKSSAIADSFTLPTMIMSVSAVVCASAEVMDERKLYLLGLAITAFGGGLLVWNVVSTLAIEGLVLIPGLVVVLTYAWFRIRGKTTT
jgi:archaellum biogenesis protein FlaJ (TadC family)